MSTFASSRRPLPLLIINGPEHFFVEGDLRSEYEKLPGARWGKDAKVHFTGGEYSTPETCPEREYSKCRECHRVTVRTRDISAVPPKLLPKSRPWIRARGQRRWIPARSTKQEAERLSSELNGILSPPTPEEKQKQTRLRVQWRRHPLGYLLSPPHREDFRLTPEQQREYEKFSLDEKKSFREMCRDQLRHYGFSVDEQISAVDEAFRIIREERKRHRT